MQARKDLRLAARFAVVFVAMRVAHDVADHWVQTGHQAATKGREGWEGRRACAAHVATYTATTTAVTVAADRVLDLGLDGRAVAVGQAISAVTHYWADRRSTLRGLADRLGSGSFYRLGEESGTLGTGAYALDQSYHMACLAVAAGATAVLSDRADRKRW